jgi:hypothetical protein
VHIYWRESYSEWNVEPTWVIQLQEKTTTSLNRQLRTGPFLDPESEFFAENIGEAARKWLGDPGIDQSSSLGIYKVVIRDRRAWLKTLMMDLDTGSLSAVVERTTKSKVFLTVVSTELDRKKTTKTQEVSDSSAIVSVPMPLSEIRVCLTDSASEKYDDFKETEQYRTRGRPSILHPPPATDPEYQELRDALDQGESENVEFKMWLPVDRKNKKSDELLKATTAFANAYGGVIYVGVTDDCEVVGTEKQLGNDDKRNEYARVVRLILNQGISPAPAHRVSWVNHAGHHVCRIQVLSKGVLHHVVEDRAIYIRRGGSDRRATPAEIEAILAERMSKRGGLFRSSDL